MPEYNGLPYQLVFILEIQKQIMSDVYEEKLNGVRIKDGFLYRSFGWPFAKIKVYKDIIVLSSLFSSEEIQKTEIKSMKKEDFNVVIGIVEITKKDGSVFQIKSWNNKILIKKLKEFGYNVR